MKHTNRASLLAACIVAVSAPAPFANAQTAAPPASGPPPEALTPEQASYLFGLTFGEQLHNIGISTQVNPDSIERGIKDALGGKKSTRPEQQQVQAFVQSVMAEAVQKNKSAAQEFLAKNGKEKGVKTTDDGLQYKVITPGDAKTAVISPNDEVTVNYRGKLLDGSEFDSSYARGTPATFKVNGVIKGWQEALVMMRPGAKWELFVPPELGYDITPRPGIPGGSLLDFEVEMISVKPSTDAAATPAPAPAPKKSLPAKPKAPTNQ